MTKFAALAISAAILTASSAAFAESREFDLPEFDRIDVSAGIKLVANVGRDQRVTVETEDGDFTDFEIEVKNGELTLSREWNRLRWHSKKADYKVILSMRDFRGLDASSGSYIKIANVDSRNVSLDLSSGAFAQIDGECDSCALNISSGANLNGSGLTCRNANIDVSSGGHGELTVSDSVIGDASSGGHVAVYGEPTRVSIDKSSGGRIKLVSNAKR